MNMHVLKASEYEQFEELRQSVFGDDKEFLDLFDSTFGDEAIHYVLTTEDQQVVAALTQFNMGEMVIPGVTNDQLVFAPGSDSKIGHYSIGSYQSAPAALVSYAICTVPGERGHGYGSRLTAFAREMAAEKGGVSVLSPAEPSLVNFYEPLGYTQQLFAEQNTAEANVNPAEGFHAERIDAMAYNELREKLLAGRLHVSLSEHALEFLQKTSYQQNGFFVLNDGEAICTCEEGETAEELVVTEILTNGLHGGDSSSAAYLLPQLACQLGVQRIHYTMPASADSESAKILGLAAYNRLYSDDKSAIALEQSDNTAAGYLGFTFG